MIKESNVKSVIRKFTAASAAVLIMSGSTFGAFAADPGLPGECVSSDGAASSTIQIIDEDDTADTSSKSSTTTTTTTTTTPAASATTKAVTRTKKTGTKVKLAKGTLKSEVKFSNGNTHPWGRQTSALNVRWGKVSGAACYQLRIKGGKYKKWTIVRNFPSSMTSCTLCKLDRDTEYQFKVRAYANGSYGAYSSVQKLRTGRIDFDQDDWKAMCRIVYHEVGRAEGACWDEPIVHVADCVINRYEAAKYLDDPLWAPYYKSYKSIKDMIYLSGGFMSSQGLANDGANYNNVTSRVKNAVFGAIYNKVTVNNIKHNRKIYYWMNGSYKPASKKCAYVYNIPWGGYFSIWSEYWG